ncbi:MAG: AzlD domain-containing protein [Ktedonobacterales bacterium]
MSPSGYPALIVAVAIVTYLTRISGFLVGRRTLPSSVNRFLNYVPVAVFAALVTINFNAGQSDTLPRLAGVAAASLGVLRFKQLWIGLVTGMATFWLACALLGISPS